MVQSIEKRGLPLMPSLKELQERREQQEQQAALEQEAKKNKQQAWMAQENFTDITGETNPYKCKMPITYGHPDFAFVPFFEDKGFVPVGAASRTETLVSAPSNDKSSVEPLGSLTLKSKGAPVEIRKAPLNFVELHRLYEEVSKVVEGVRELVSTFTSKIAQKKQSWKQKEVSLEEKIPDCAELKEVVTTSTTEEKCPACVELKVAATTSTTEEKIPGKPKRKASTGKIYRGKDYIFKKKTIVTPVVWAAFEEILQGLDDGTKRFFKHLYNCSCALKREEGWVEIPSLLIRQEFGISAENITQLVTRGIVEVNNSYEVGVCKKYRIPAFGTQAIEESILDSLESGERARVSLETGKSTKAALTSSIYDENRNKLPELVSSRILSFKNAVVFDKKAALHFIRQKKLAAREELNKNGKTKLHEALYMSYRNDVNCLMAVIFGHAAIDLPNGKCSYVPAYKAQVSGRLTHLGGGFQSASRGLTAAAFCKTDYINYSLKSAQPTVYLQMLEQYKISDGGWLQDYISGKTGKVEIAKRIGIQVDTWKRVLLAVLMGAQIPAVERAEKAFKSISRVLEAQARNKDKDKKKYKKFEVNTMFACFLEEFDNDPHLAFQAFRRFNKVCSPFLTAVKEVGTLIQTAIRDQDSTTLPQLFKCKEGNYIKNAAGMSLQLAGIPKANLISKVQAHLLQGSEACLISHIISQAKEYGFKPILDFHDGFLSQGEVPAEAVSKAIAACGIRGALDIINNPLNYHVVNPYRYDIP